MSSLAQHATSDAMTPRSRPAQPVSPIRKIYHQLGERLVLAARAVTNII